MSSDHQLDLRVLRFRSRPDSEEPALLALELVAAGRTYDALEVIDAALTRDPDDVDLLLSSGIAAVRGGQLTFAQLVLTRAAKKAPEWSEPLAWLAKVLRARDREERAAEVARRAIALGSADEDVLEIVRRHDRRIALDTRLARFQGDPESDEPSLLARALLDEGRERDALEVIELALSREEDADVLVTEARIRIARHERARAKEALRRALVLAPEWTEPARLLGELLADEGALLEALPIVERALAQSLDDDGLVALRSRIEDQMREAGIVRPEHADASLDALLSSLERIGRPEERDARPVREPTRRRQGWLPRIAKRFFGVPTEPRAPRPIARA